jgi:hypothetical protein
MTEQEVAIMALLAAVHTVALAVLAVVNEAATTKGE